jgi:hypothetical protein
MSFEYYGLDENQPSSLQWKLRLNQTNLACFRNLAFSSDLIRISKCYLGFKNIMPYC